MKEFKHPEFPVAAGRTVTERIGIEQLKQKFIDAVKAHPNFQDMGRDVFHYAPWFIKSLTPQIEKDLAKVKFDTENVSMGNDIQAPFQVLPNGLAILTVQAGGDWEVPVFFIIYWDGLELRAYIPKNGNFWNRTSGVAYGNDDISSGDAESADSIDCRKWYGMPYQNDEMIHEPGITCVQDAISDLGLMLADVQKRIQVSDAAK